MGGFKLSNPKTILDLLVYDLTTFFYEDDYEEIYSEEILDTFLIDYQKKLPWLEMDVFDRVIFRVFTEKTNLTGTNHINVTLLSRDLDIPLDKTENILIMLEELYKADDNKRSLWLEEEKLNLLNGNVIRMWTLGEEKNIYSIRFNYNKGKGAQLQIMFYTNLLRSLGKL